MKTLTMSLGECSPKKIQADTKLICSWNGRYHRAVETKDFIYFCNYQEGDDNGSTKMYRKSDLSLVSDNYFGTNDLFEVILEKTYTYLSHSMKYNVKEMQKEHEQI
jgi:hypothetical protein